MSEAVRLPPWIKRANRLNMTLHRLGLAVGPVRLISVPGRRTGQLRTTPVAPLTMDGQRYVIAGHPDADWVKNARAAGWALLSRGRRGQRVGLVEVAGTDKVPVVHTFHREVRRGAKLLLQMHRLPETPAGLDQLASRCPVFRITDPPLGSSEAATTPWHRPAGREEAR